MTDIKIGKKLSEYNSILKENDELYRGVAKNFGLPDCAFWILYILRENDRTFTQSEIRCSIYQPKQTVNSSLKKLEYEGYIERVRIDGRRGKQIQLTGKGMALAEKTVDRVLAAEQEALSELTEEEQDVFMGLFRKYTDFLQRSFRDITGE